MRKLFAKVCLRQTIYLGIIFITLTESSAISSNYLTNTNKHRGKRNAAQLLSLIYKETSYNALKLSNYGNWCGKGGDKMGDGSYIDGCDLCCKKHDNCYYKARHEFESCKPLFAIYEYREGEKEPNVNLKGLTSQEGRNLIAKRKKPSCDLQANDGPSCKHAICQCDIRFIMCLKKEPCDPALVSDRGGYWWIPG